MNLRGAFTRLREEVRGDVARLPWTTMATMRLKRARHGGAIGVPFASLANPPRTCHNPPNMNLFPRTLDRIPYLIRSLVLTVILFVIYGALTAAMVPFMPTEDSGPGAIFILLIIVEVLIGLAAFVYGIMALIIPRIRSCGWSPWLALILLIPGIGGIFSLVLLFMPPVEPSRA